MDLSVIMEEAESQEPRRIIIKTATGETVRTIQL